MKKGLLQTTRSPQTVGHRNTYSTRGDFPSRPLALYLCSLLVESMLIYFIRKLCMSPFTWGMVALYAATGYRVIDQNEEECMQTPGEHHCAKQ